jgi:phospholipase/lecithinase/hemolysin
MPDLASTPLFRSATPEARGFLTALTDAFNTNLDPVLQSLDATYPV